MSIPTKESSQDKASDKVDRNLRKEKKEIPLLERDFDTLVTLAEQFEWLKQKRRQKDNEEYIKSKNK